MTETTEFKSWAKVEVMGHQTHIGFVTTEAYGGTVMFRVDQPAVPGVEETLERPEWSEAGYVPAGSVVRRGEIQPATVLVGAASIYRIIPCDEAAAMKAIRSTVRPPLIIVKLSGPIAITAGDILEEQDDPSESDEPGAF